MSDVAATVDRAPVEAPPSRRLDRLAEVLVDRLNPILVREVRQAMNGKAFAITGGLALVATVLIALMAAAGDREVGRGGMVFLGTLVVLAPIVLFIVPLQAFLSTRHEVTSGTVEHLLLSRLRPGQIVRGKIAAATVQFVLYLAIFAPLVAMTFLLRGIDVPTIAYAIGLAFVSGIAASSLAVACGALSRWPAAFRVLPFAIVILGLGGLTVTVMGAMDALLYEVTREIVRGNFWQITTAILLPTAAFTVLCALVGTAALSHPYENRSTAFRVFAIVATVALFAWMAILIEPIRRGTVFLREATPFWYLSATVAFSFVLFPLFAATEDFPLSPRLRARVPRSGLLAGLVTPLLPGAGRGFLFSMLFLALGFALPVAVRVWGGYDAPEGRAVNVAAMVWLYLLFYVGLGTLARRFYPRGSKGTWLARGTVLLVLLLAVLIPLLVTVFTDRNAYRAWSALNLLDPFTTIGMHDSRSSDASGVIAALGALAGIVTVANLPSVFLGISEVFEASRARRRRAD